MIVSTTISPIIGHVLVARDLKQPYFFFYTSCVFANEEFLSFPGSKNRNRVQGDSWHNCRRIINCWALNEAEPISACMHAVTLDGIVSNNNGELGRETVYRT
jgi:hypothetical protein